MPRWRAELLPQHVVCADVSRGVRVTGPSVACNSAFSLAPFRQSPPEHNKTHSKDDEDDADDARDDDQPKGDACMGGHLTTCQPTSQLYTMYNHNMVRDKR